jgi:hypothetical protein
MEENEKQIVTVELVTAVFIWNCPNCNFENEEIVKRSAYAVSELSCERCGIKIEKKGEIHWSVK